MLCILCYVLRVMCGRWIGGVRMFGAIGEGGWTIYVKLMGELVLC
jgi:hypothetical protein